MAGEWRDAVLSDLVAIQRGHDLTESERRSGSVPVLGSAGQNGFHDTALAPGPGVAIGRSGASFGQVSYCEVAYWPHNTVLYVTDFRGNYPRFVYYCLKAIDFSRYNSGSAQQSLNRNYIYSAPLRIPDVHTQHVIAHILGTLDDKIELNRRMSETLEHMARALFKSWFVDFDPVRAKADGRDTGLPKSIADLFPDRLVNSELGEIPEGWEIASLGALIDMVKGRSYKSEELIESDTALVTLKSFARGGGYRPDGLKPFVGTYKAEQIVVPGELVIACTDVTQDAEVIGRPAIVRGASGYKRLVASLDTLIVRPRDSSAVTRSYLYFLGGTDSFVAHTYAHTTGTTVLHLAKNAVPSFKFSRPSTQLVLQFDAFAKPALERMEAIEEESSTLAAVRDALLPRLVAGELRVKDAEKLIGRAV
jgi:type I restriction enzyme S subunit